MSNQDSTISIMENTKLSFPFDQLGTLAIPGGEDDDMVPTLVGSSSLDHEEREDTSTENGCHQSQTDNPIKFSKGRKQFEPFSDGITLDDEWERLPSACAFDGVEGWEAEDEERKAGIRGSSVAGQWPKRRFLTLVFLLSGLVAVLTSLWSKQYVKVRSLKQILKDQVQVARFPVLLTAPNTMKPIQQIPVKAFRPSPPKNITMKPDQLVPFYFHSLVETVQTELESCVNVSLLTSKSVVRSPAIDKPPAGRRVLRPVLRQLKRTVGRALEESSVHHHYTVLRRRFNSEPRYVKFQD